MSKRGAGIPAPGTYGGRVASPIMLHMTSPAATAPTRRLVLVPAEPRAGRGAASVRHYRLARLRLEGREVGPGQRFDHCKRSYD
jgi:hypothetical protein